MKRQGRWAGSGLCHRGAPPRRMAVVALAVAGTAALAAPAHAGVSAQDGYGPNGTYQFHVGLDLYAWLPATDSSVTLSNGAQRNVGQGIPSPSALSQVLDGAFMGAALVRYGPWSVLVDVDYVSLTQSGSVGLDSLGRPLSLKTTISATRVTPGIGYQVYNGITGHIPTTLDAQVGAAWFGTSPSLELERTDPNGTTHVGGVGANLSLVQPWIGLRAAIYPGPRWRLTLGALVQGFGVDGGTWGWGTQFTVAWAATNWLNLLAGFRALSSSTNPGEGEHISSIRLTTYGPQVGVGFSF
jgi:hypothetical protein